MRKFFYVLKAFRFNVRKAIQVYNDIMLHDRSIIHLNTYDTFHDFVEKHKGVLSLNDVTIDYTYMDDDMLYIVDCLKINAWDFVLKEKRYYYVDIETKKLEIVEETL